MSHRMLIGRIIEFVQTSARFRFAFYVMKRNEEKTLSLAWNFILSVFNNALERIEHVSNNTQRVHIKTSSSSSGCSLCLVGLLHLLRVSAEARAGALLVLWLLLSWWRNWPIDRARDLGSLVGRARRRRGLSWSRLWLRAAHVGV